VTLDESRLAPAAKNRSSRSPHAEPQVKLKFSGTWRVENGIVGLDSLSTVPCALWGDYCTLPQVAPLAHSRSRKLS
jgi:hypothetical protein